MSDSRATLQMRVIEETNRLVNFDSRILMGSISYDLHGIIESFWSGVVWLRDIWPDLGEDSRILFSRIGEQLPLIMQSEGLFESCQYPLVGLANSIKEFDPELSDQILQMYEA